MSLFTILNQFLNPQWIHNVIQRFVLMNTILISVINHRQHMGDDNQFATGYGSAMWATAILEISIYLHVKQKL